MFTKKKIVVACFLALFGMQEAAYAASISTRVRVLEAKVVKQDKEMKSLRSEVAQQGHHMQSELSKIQVLENKLDELVRLQKAVQHKGTHSADKRYSYP